MDLSIIFIFATIIIAGGVMLALISGLKHGNKKLDIEKYRTKCLEIENSFKKDQEHSYTIAVLNADKLLGQALSELNFKGQTMGEKMKSARNVFSDNNGVWNAHKLRNRIAHETDIVVKYEEAKRALMNFRQALRDLGAI